MLIVVGIFLLASGLIRSEDYVDQVLGFKISIAITGLWMLVFSILSIRRLKYRPGKPYQRVW